MPLLRRKKWNACHGAWIAALVISLGAGCSRSSPSTEVDEVDESAASTQTSPDEPTHAPHRVQRPATAAQGVLIDEQKIKTAAKQHGWEVVTPAPLALDVATPSDTRQWRFAIEKHTRRVDVWGFGYSLEGYATAHVRAMQGEGDTAMRQQGRNVVVVRAQSKEVAQEALHDLMEE